MTINTNLTPNELKAALVLVGTCLAGMGGKRPADLAHDEYTWIDASDLIKNGWTRHEAAGTLGALEEKGFVHLDGKDSFMSTAAWKYLDTIWDAKATA